MLLQESSKHRPGHFGPFPFETLERDTDLLAVESTRKRLEREAPRKQAPKEPFADSSSDIRAACKQYSEVFLQYRNPEAATSIAPVPGNLDRRSADIKGGVYFLDAAHAGICALPDNAWLAESAQKPHSHAIVMAVEIFGEVESDNLASQWLNGSYRTLAETRAAGIAVNLAGYCAQLGFSATAHTSQSGDVDIERLAVMSGICCRTLNGVESPYLQDQIVLVAVTTDYELATDLPLAPTHNRNSGARYWLGINGAQSGRERNRRAKRKTHMSAYPMEQVKRVDKPTTLIIDDEVPRVPHRASFFERPRFGDMGAKAKHERTRFAFKTPSAQSYMPMIGAMVPLQKNEVAVQSDPDMLDAETNSRAVKSLAYALGADLAGICEIPDYAWYSHHNDGKPLTPYHRYAVVMLIDQGYETMEGASGDDWISGSQSMRAYMRGAEIAGILARFLCDKGFSSSPQTNVLSHVLHIPLILLAGLGELSRIGELVLNPFVGPRFKSVVVTTDLPLVPDKPIDFGLQYFCSNCQKCARECPCSAIPVTDKVMFNGYEMWKIDAERCSRYRITNQKGAGCGRCMKTCPLNKVPGADGSVLTRVASWLGINAMWLKPILVPIAVKLDDFLGNGTINPVKKWWLDLEIVDGVTGLPRVGTNQREIEPDKNLPADERIVYYHANLMPPPDATEPVPLDRKAAKSQVRDVESPEQARQRIKSGAGRPSHYIPVRCIDPNNDLPQ